MAYIADGVPVVTDAATGDARTVLAGRPQPEWYDGNVDGVVTGLLRRGPPWTQAVLSPDGEWLLLVQAPVLLGLETGSSSPGDRADSTSIGESLAPTGDLYLVRISTGEVTPVSEADPVSDAQGVASVANTNARVGARGWCLRLRLWRPPRRVSTSNRQHRAFSWCRRRRLRSPTLHGALRD